MLRNIVGLPARGDDFFDREEMLDLLWDRLETSNILLAAPRRFGKTSVMYRLADRPRGAWKAVHVDAESIREPVNFVIALLDALMADRFMRKLLLRSWEHTCEWTRGLLGDLEIATPWDVNFKIRLKEEIGPHWQERGEELLQALRGCQQKLLLIIDELPVMLYLFADNGVSAADTRAFLYWFRRLRIDPHVGLTDCRFLVGGSIGIEHCLTELSAADSFNDFERVAVGELAAERAPEFLKRLLRARRLDVSSATRRRILSLIGTPIPYFIQVFVAELAAEAANGGRRIGPKRLEGIYHHQVLGSACKTYFQHYYDRLRRYDKLEERAAKAILKQLALAYPSAIQRSQLQNLYRKEVAEAASDDGFTRLIGDLENDFYIRYQPEDDGYVFAAKMLCDWWRRYYAF